VGLVPTLVDIREARAHGICGFDLLEHMRSVSRLAHMAQGTMLSSAAFRPDLIHATGGLLVLLAAMTLSVFKPWGMTPYGRRRTSVVCLLPSPNSETTVVREQVFAKSKPRWARIVWIHAAHAVVIVCLFAVILHVTGINHH